MVTMPKRDNTGQFTKKPKMIGPKRKSNKQWPELNPEDAKSQKGKHEVKFVAKTGKVHFWAHSG